MKVIIHLLDPMMSSRSTLTKVVTPKSFREGEDMLRRADCMDWYVSLPSVVDDSTLVSNIGYSIRHDGLSRHNAVLARIRREFTEVQ